MAPHAGGRSLLVGVLASGRLGDARRRGGAHAKWPVENPAPASWIVTGVVFVGVNVALIGADMSPIFLAALLAALVGWLTLMALTTAKERRSGSRK